MSLHSEVGLITMSLYQMKVYSTTIKEHQMSVNLKSLSPSKLIKKEPQQGKG